MTVKPETLEKLRHVSVATLCTQLFRRGLRNVFIQGIARLTEPSGGNMVGPAFTVRKFGVPLIWVFPYTAGDDEFVQQPSLVPSHLAGRESRLAHARP